MKRNNFLFIGLIASIICYAGQSFEQQELNLGWRIKKIAPTQELNSSNFSEIEKSTDWIPVKLMPAMIHEVLMTNGLMEPFYEPGIARKYLWVSESDWVYENTFESKNTKEISFLHFKGLDCIADIYLNNILIASNYNMHYPLRVNVSGHLQKTNKLLLHFHTVFENKDGKSTPLKSFRGKEIRRAGQNYINYLGPDPYFSKFGVYDKILLETTGGSEITSTLVGTELNENLSEGKLSVNAKGESTQKDVKIAVNLLDQGNKKVASITKNIAVNDGKFDDDVFVNLASPTLWWPRGYGKPTVYTAEIKLLVNGKTHQTITKTVGFRRVTQPKLLHFEINNVPVKLWGGNWVAPNWHTAVWNHTQAEKLIKMAELANFNAFRVWGVVEAPDDDFYEMCDRKGFMLWQDFTEMPLSGDAKSLATINDEAPKLIKRLKNHPSVLMWNGGNENALWFHPEYNGQLLDRGEWQGVKGGDELQKILKQLDPQRYFQPTSPWLGIDPNDPRIGSTHGYTNMWFVPGYDYVNFAAEDTRIAAPVLPSCEKFMTKEDIWPSNYSPVYAHGNKLPFPEPWKKYMSTEAWKKTGPVELFYDATNAEQLIYRIGMAEALYYQTTVERQRRGRDATDTTDTRKCGGYLVWKYNDSWPQIYSAKVDYFLEPLHSYYALKRAYEPVLLSFEVGTYIWLWAVNDTREPVKGKVTISLFHLDQNKIRKTIERDIVIQPGKSKVIVQLDEAGIGSLRREHILHASLHDDAGKKIAETFSLTDIERRVTFPDAKIDVTIKDGKLVLKSDKYAHAVTLEGNDNGDKSGFLFSDNYFELMPGEEKIIDIQGDKKQGVISVKAFYSNQTTKIDWNVATKKEPWENLFNGKNYAGWSVIGSTAKSWIADSAFVCHKVINTPEHTFIRTNKQYDNFILEGDCKIEGDFHTGFLFRCIDAPDTASVSLYGYQVKIDPTTRKWTGGIFDDFGKTWHWLYTLKEDSIARTAFKMNEWNHFRIEAIGSTMKVWVNNIPTTHLINTKYTKGYIALKIHSMGNTPELEKIHGYFKNIRIITESPEKYSRHMPLYARKQD